MICSLDTNVLIDIANGRAQVRQAFDTAVQGGATIVACPVATHEFVYGALISPRPEHQLAKARKLIGDLRVVELSHGDGITAAAIRRDLRRRGKPIGAYDLLIAAQALNRNWTLVSHNLSEMELVEGLTIVDWVSQSQEEASHGRHP